MLILNPRLHGVFVFIIISILSASYSLGQAAEPSPSFTGAQLEFFEKEIRPVLVNRCYSCHSHKSKKLKAGLRLDSRSAVFRGGETGPAAVAGKPAKSLMIDAVNYGDTYQMPPEGSF